MWREVCSRGVLEVKIDDAELVSVLKKTIKEKNPARIKCDASDRVLE
ncbi:hypothetical protein PF005_g4365 [Phytophthora fragariae]|uniref:Crinkler effector protein N-terminal domain-containing protein n=1 Tax=Phytophthora fragariae TaxID=53985 RepID=A0A6A3FMH8_9STRA|nr:hypothetical protein PF003_g4897 [Phytophthora fragariae]KAE8945531.1 hypothetical protein PF009_g4826 [Phytophthora fragariae]KAE9024446.1 hypothetical protein PF011_g3508 [Phytophthora fragariae]KAE9130567.1 hypothetical protein PF007_g4468 [Phytophthora fragariae]KAE9130608.1 hypothetical protein PF010_g3782 [Phytophthora fragariae]